MSIIYYFRFRKNSLNPEHPFMRGTSQMPDVYFQLCESSNSYYNIVPKIIQYNMDKFCEKTGRSV